MIRTRLAPLLEWAVEERLPTPLHLFSERGVTAAVSYLRWHLEARISYATKANPHPLMLAALRDRVDEFNVTNLAHLRAVLAAGVEPGRVAFINPVIAADTARKVLAMGVDRFVVDDARGLQTVASLGADVRLTLRLRPPWEGQSGRSVVRFGNTADALHDLALRAGEAGVRIEALSFFIGMHTESLEEAVPYEVALKELAALHGRLSADGIAVPVINIGGGFPGAYRRFHREHPDFFDRISDEIDSAFSDDVIVVCEPGRYLSEPAFAMLTRVIADRRIDGQRMTYLDGSGFAGLFETTFVDPGGSDLCLVTDRPGPATPTHLLGPIMDSFDVIKRDALLPPLEGGDMLLFPNTGAYSWGYAAACEGVRQPDVVALPPELDELIARACLD